MLSELIKLRKKPHKYPELSGKETNTTKRIKAFIETHNNTQIIDAIGGHGLAAIYEFSNNGPTILIRCELDALPIQEKNTFNYKSKNINVSHKCGHDDNMAMVAGLLFSLKEKPLKKGTVILLFQPAEETGKGELHYTIRTWSEKTLNALENKMKEIIERVSKIHNLQFKTKWFEYFPTTVNNETCNALINDAAKQNNFKQLERTYPLKFGEDFVWFSQNYKVEMFGLGSGLNSPALHHADYDLLDELLETGIAMYRTIIDNIITKQ